MAEIYHRVTFNFSSNDSENPYLNDSGVKLNSVTLASANTERGDFDHIITLPYSDLERMSKRDYWLSNAGELESYIWETLRSIALNTSAAT